MILPDINLLVHAFNSDAADHRKARAWWESRLFEEEIVALPWVVVFGFIRITTNRKIVSRPWTASEALDVVDSWLQFSHVQMIEPTPRHWKVFGELLRRVGVAGNLTTDAHLAALAIEHGCMLYSTDADFARFPGLRWKNPLR